MEVALRAPEPTAASESEDPAGDALLSLLDAQREGRYEIDAAYRVAQVMRERAHRGEAVMRQDLDEAAALLGRRPRNLQEADAALEERIAAPGFEIGADWLRYMHRRALREESLLLPAMRELADARFQKLRID
jgi:hypothetical protein